MGLIFHHAVRARFSRAPDAGIKRFLDFMVENLKEWVDDPYPPASEAGHPPHKRSGVLQAGLFWYYSGGKYYLASSAPYTEHLEFGTRNMAPRPFMKPLIEQYRPLAEKMIGQTAREEMR